MSKQNSMKTVLMAVTLCALAGLANSASAVEICKEADGKCRSNPVNAGVDRRVNFRCTITQPDKNKGICKIIEVASGKAAVTINFTSTTGNLRSKILPTPGAYLCVSETRGVNGVGHRVFCSIE